ncbi:hypothetical protein L9F63_003425 [Diploptera punctata]|uniref:Uncharacterized protein n=1 Tax=Diploptera punctata TaxID=6984 RepID=A0AAD8E9X6_DIPPU|nr:hypothetical protein L9F63_003425 [Diploptera punctata]
MVIKSICIVLMVFLTEEFIPTDGTTVLYRSSYLIPPATSLVHFTDVKSIFDTDKPDAELSKKLIELASDIKGFIPKTHGSIARMTNGIPWIEDMHSALILSSLKVKDGRSNPTFRSSLARELELFKEYGETVLDELRKLNDEAGTVIETIKNTSEMLKQDKDKDY